MERVGSVLWFRGVDVEYLALAESGMPWVLAAIAVRLLSDATSHVRWRSTGVQQHMKTNSKFKAAGYIVIQS